MTDRRGLLALCAALGLAWSVGVTAQNKDEKKQDDAQKKEIQSVVKVVDDFAAGQPAPNDFDIKWVREDILKAQGNKEYVPFTVSIDPSKVTGGSTIAFYWRVVSKSAAAPTETAAATTGQKKDDKKDK